eukprot:2637832-Heterocapsa_arctica.AAC.1
MPSHRGSSTGNWQGATGGEKAHRREMSENEFHSQIKKQGAETHMLRQDGNGHTQKVPGTY